MRKFALFIGALVMAAAIVWLIGHHATTNARIEPPPEPPKAFPDHDENASAARTLAIASRLDDEDVRSQRRAEIEYLRKGEGPPPASLAAFFNGNRATIVTLRAQLATDAPPAWKQRATDLLDTPQPNFILINQLCTMFAAHALAEHQAQDNAGAWASLQASWVLARSLWARPEVLSAMAALGTSRLVAIVAAKLPPPAPRWWPDFATFDPRPPLARALEYEAWATHERADRYPVGEPGEDEPLRDSVRKAIEPFARPIQVLEADARVRDLRELVRVLPTIDPCAPVKAPSRERWTGTLLRLNRFLIEREGAVKRLALPQFSPGSICKSAHWTWDGTVLKFAGNAPVPDTRIIGPLVFR